MIIRNLKCVPLLKSQAISGWETDTEGLNVNNHVTVLSSGKTFGETGAYSNLQGR